MSPENNTRGTEGGDSHRSRDKTEPRFPGEEIGRLDEELLDLPETGSERREELFRETCRVVRAHGRRRRLRRWASIAAVYLFGFGTAWVFALAEKPSTSRREADSHPKPGSPQQNQGLSDPGGTGDLPEERRDLEPDPNDSPQRRKETASRRLASSERVPRMKEGISAEGLENLARAGSRAGRADALRRAGDLYLSADGDLEGALRCYRRMIELLPKHRRSNVDPADSWLLIALKQGRRES